jgi:hypothetical protein
VASVVDIDANQLAGAPSVGRGDACRELGGGDLVHPARNELGTHADRRHT